MIRGGVVVAAMEESPTVLHASDGCDG